jgi:hypothetical protein
MQQIIAKGLKKNMNYNLVSTKLHDEGHAYL